MCCLHTATSTYTSMPTYSLISCIQSLDRHASCQIVPAACALRCLQRSEAKRGKASRGAARRGTAPDLLCSSASRIEIVIIMMIFILSNSNNNDNTLAPPWACRHRPSARRLPREARRSQPASLLSCV